MLWDDMKLVSDVKFLLTRRLNQDCLENLFSIIRQKGGFRDNPSPSHFQQTFKQVLAKSFLTNSTSSNCESDNSDYLLHLVKSTVGKASKAEHAADVAVLDTEINVADELHDNSVPKSLMPTTSSIPEQNALYYVAGYVCKKYLAHHNCSSCTRLLTDTHATYNDDAGKSYSHFKAYDHRKGDFGGLTSPSESFINYLRLCEDVFANNFMILMHKDKVHETMFSKVVCLVDQSWFTDNSTCGGSLQVIVRKYLTMRIRYSVKFFNDTLSKQPSNKRNRKTLKVSHL